MAESLLKGVYKNDHLSISKAITLIENNLTTPANPFNKLQLKNKSLRIGITGPPGAGKSTLTNQLIETILFEDKTVGVIAVDPTSPFSGGSLLGDRVRMNKYMWDDRVFIRSMGNHGDLGGLARKSQEVGDILEASGKNYIIYETVGVGQGEVDIATIADITIVVLVPESGDEVQLMKAGLIEIADLFVINKSDRIGASKLASSLKSILHYFTKNEKKEPEVFNVISTKGKGIIELYNGIEKLIDVMKKDGKLEVKRLRRIKERVKSSVMENLENEFWTEKKNREFQNIIKKRSSVDLNIDLIVRKLLKNK